MSETQMDNRTRPHMKTDTLHRILTFCALAGFSFSSPLSLAQSQPSGGFVTVTATVTGAPLDKLFVHVRVTQN